jgi:putative ABC transport system permease protein
VGSLISNVRAALNSLREQRNRAILSALGITVGSLAIVLLISIAKGVQADVSREVEDLGANLLIVLPGRIEEGSFFNPGILGISYLKEEDVQRVLKLEGVRRATPLTFVGTGAKHAGKSSSLTLIIAVEPDWFRIRSIDLAEGRVFNGEDEDKPVCVLGSIAKEKLFGTESVVGKSVDYNGRKYEILGVTASKGQATAMFSQGGFENVVFLPYRYVKSIQPNAQIDRIFIQTDPGREPKSLVQSVDRTLGARLGRETYSVLTQEDLLKLLFKVMSILTWLLTGLTSIALFVGGVGIMTVMLMSVNERTKEIGIRKTVGARRIDVFVQFFSEAVILSFVGGLAGLAISYAACLALTKFTVLKPLITFDTVALSLGVCLGVGAVFGLLPAMRAASRDPVQSLRYD